MTAECMSYFIDECGSSCYPTSCQNLDIDCINGRMVADVMKRIFKNYTAGIRKAKQKVQGIQHASPVTTTMRGRRVVLPNITFRREGNLMFLC